MELRCYQLLVLDPTGKTRSENATSLMFLIRDFSSLWQAPRVTEADCTIVDGHSKLSVAAIERAGALDPDEKTRTFLLTLIGPYEAIEPRREPLAGFLKSLGFELLYVLRDEVSELIACKLYPHLYRVENLLRGYLIRFMATQVGPEWWELTASAEMADKAKMRKKNEKVFGRHVEASAYLIDFDELGELVYEQSSGFLTREDILDRIRGLPETPDAIKALKNELRSNYQKFFKESFADKGFKETWTQFEGLRNKIAHNNLFTADDLARGERLATEITAIISGANTGAAALVITTEEREAIREQVSARNDSLPTVDNSTFLSELESQERFYATKPNGFVGVSKFVNIHLARKGFSPLGSRRALEELKDLGQIEIYHVPNPNDENFPTAALKRTSPTSA